MSEAATLRLILDYLSAKHILAFRQNTGVARFGEGKAQRFVRFGHPGMADIISFPDCHPVWIEVKSSTGKQRPEQQAFQKIVQDNGHGYILARSLDDVILYLNRKEHES